MAIFQMSALSITFFFFFSLNDYRGSIFFCSLIGSYLSQRNKYQLNQNPTPLTLDPNPKPKLLTLNRWSWQSRTLYRYYETSVIFLSCFFWCLGVFLFLCNSVFARVFDECLVPLSCCSRAYYLHQQQEGLYRLWGISYIFD